MLLAQAPETIAPDFPRVASLDERRWPRRILVGTHAGASSGAAVVAATAFARRFHVPVHTATTWP